MRESRPRAVFVIFLTLEESRKEKQYLGFADQGVCVCVCVWDFFFCTFFSYPTWQNGTENIEIKVDQQEKKRNEWPIQLLISYSCVLLLRLSAMVCGGRRLRQQTP
ncbi:hypothetical protein B0T09DRAFT_46590 [Sordaria sp. MPI-SDFR-AT-0083]|nr:hypothetical protein B0T09DRAFT_46590 [Sordaria sp. MPI-SDFR-AT-0083]